MTDLLARVSRAGTDAAKEKRLLQSRSDPFAAWRYFGFRVGNSIPISRINICMSFQTSALAAGLRNK